MWKALLFLAITFTAHGQVNRAGLSLQCDQKMDEVLQTLRLSTGSLPLAMRERLLAAASWPAPPDYPGDTAEQTIWYWNTFWRIKYLVTATSPQVLIVPPPPGAFGGVYESVAQPQDYGAAYIRQYHAGGEFPSYYYLVPSNLVGPNCLGCFAAPPGPQYIPGYKPPYPGPLPGMAGALYYPDYWPDTPTRAQRAAVVDKYILMITTQARSTQRSIAALIKATDYSQLQSVSLDIATQATGLNVTQLVGLLLDKETAIENALFAAENNIFQTANAASTQMYADFGSVHRRVTPGIFMEYKSIAPDILQLLDDNLISRLQKIFQDIIAQLSSEISQLKQSLDGELQKLKHEAEDLVDKEVSKLADAIKSAGDSVGLGLEILAAAVLAVVIF